MLQFYHQFSDCIDETISIESESDVFVYKICSGDVLDERWFEWENDSEYIPFNSLNSITLLNIKSVELL